MLNEAHTWYGYTAVSEIMKKKENLVCYCEQGVWATLLPLPTRNAFPFIVCDNFATIRQFLA